MYQGVRERMDTPLFNANYELPWRVLEFGPTSFMSMDVVCLPIQGGGR